MPLLLWVLLCCGLLPLQLQACLLQMQAQHFPPRFIKQETEQGEVRWQGFNAELYHALARRLDCQAELLEIPWGRALQMLAEGELSMMSNASWNEERAAFAHFIGPVSMERTLVVGPVAMQGKVTDLRQLTQVPGQISLMQGVYYGSDFAREAEQNPALQQRLAYVSTSQQKLELLLRGRVQLTFEDSLTLQQLYQQQVLDPHDFIALFTLHENPVYLMVSKEQFDQPRLALLEAAWLQLVEDGTLAELKQRYFDTSP